MIVKVKARAQPRGDRAGDPLDGLVNMFDLGIVLAVAFLVAVLQAHGLTHVLTQHTSPAAKIQKTSARQTPLKPTKTKVKVKGAASVGEVYQLPNGSLVYVKKTK
jgi:hypothetical protein